MSPSAPRRVSSASNARPSSATPPAKARRVVGEATPKPPVVVKQPSNTPSPLPALDSTGKPRPLGRGGKPLTDKQLANLRAHAAKKGEPSRNVEGVAKDPRKLAVMEIFRVFREEKHPVTGRSFVTEFWLRVTESTQLMDKLFDKLLSTMTPEQITQNFQSIFGGQGNSYEALLIQNRGLRRDAIKNAEARIENADASELVEAHR